jgi:orotidine-5'-phosphate decarboxylase
MGEESKMIIDRLYEKVEKNGPVCVGLDTDISYIPEEFLKKVESVDDALFEFNKRIIDATSDIAACFKPQIAYYEAFGLSGLSAYKRTLKYIRSIGGIVIADIKRGDIAKTAEMYARAHFEGDFESDFITLNPYMGLDSIEPYLHYVKSKEKGLFPLIRTSNSGAKDVQYIEDSNGKRVYDHVGEKLYKLSEEFKGECGYSSIGGVVGCTHIDESIELREDFENMFFLVPGYGAQGGGGTEAATYLRDGNGSIINSSRGILLNYKNFENGHSEFDLCARKEVLRMRRDIEDAVKLLGRKGI